MGAGASANGATAEDATTNLADKTAGEVAAFVADQGKDFEGYKAAIADQGIDGKALVSMNPEKLEEAMDAAKIGEEHREVLREACARCGGGWASSAPCCGLDMPAFSEGQ